MMKFVKHWLAVPVTLAMMAASTTAGLSTPAQSLSPGFTPDPIEFKGMSEASQENACDKLGTTPQQVIELTSSFGYLRFSLDGSEGQPALVIQRVGQTKQCVLGGPNQKIEYPGYWEPGVYNIFVVDRSGQSHPYTLSITQVRSPGN